MRHTTDFSVRYLTDEPVPIRDIIASLQGVETALNEAGKLLPALVKGLDVEKIEIRVQEISQHSPLREIFGVAIFLAFQEQLEEEVPQLFTDATGMIIPDRFDTVITVLAMIVVFYGAGALKDLVFGRGNEGAAEAQLDGLISELAIEMGTSEYQIRQVLKDRYAEKTMFRRLANATSRFFLPSKHQNSAPVEINNRHIPHDVVQDIPADFLVEDAAEQRPSRNFTGALIELHAQDRDHTGRGWAAVVDGVSHDRLRMKLMENVSADEVWRKDRILGDITVIYERIGSDLLAREVHLHRVVGDA